MFASRIANPPRPAAPPRDHPGLKVLAACESGRLPSDAVPYAFAGGPVHERNARERLRPAIDGWPGDTDPRLTLTSPGVTRYIGEDPNVRCVTNSSPGISSADKYGVMGSSLR